MENALSVTPRLTRFWILIHFMGKTFPFDVTSNTSIEEVLALLANETRFHGRLFVSLSINGPVLEAKMTLSKAGIVSGSNLFANGGSCNLGDALISSNFALVIVDTSQFSRTPNSYYYYYHINIIVIITP